MIKIALCDDDDVFCKKLNDLMDSLVECNLVVQCFHDADLGGFPDTRRTLSNYVSGALVPHIG